MTRCLFFALLGAASGVVLPPPRVEGNPPRVEGNPPRVEGNPPRVEGNPPRVERRSWAIWALLASRRAQHKRQYLLAATATPRLRHVTTDAEGAFAVHDFDIGGNVTYFSLRGYSTDESRRRRGCDVEIPSRSADALQVRMLARRGTMGLGAPARAIKRPQTQRGTPRDRVSRAAAAM